MSDVKLVPDDSGARATSFYRPKVLAALGVIKATPGVLYGVSGYSSLAAGQFIQLFDATTVPANGTAPDVTIYVSGAGNFSADFGQYGLPFSTGIAISNSTTADTKTLGSANCYFNAQYK